jgi:hypothetical protein
MPPFGVGFRGIVVVFFNVVFVLLPGISFIVHLNKDSVNSFALHPYESQAATFAGPFLGKIRVANSPHAVIYAPSGVSQSTCVNKTSDEKQKCLLQNAPNLYLGKVHSSWSVLGAQSRYILLKHIFFISCVLAVFSVTHLAMRSMLDEAKLKEWHDRLQHMVVVVSTILFCVSIGLDIKDEMHSVDQTYNNQVAIGSITTGASFSFVALLLISASHVDKVKKHDSATAVGRWNDHIHYNIYASYTILFLLPLYMLLSLSRTAAIQTALVDVHVQLLFCGCIFYAVLDVIQTRVSSVLAAMYEQTSAATEPGLPKQSEAAKKQTESHDFPTFFIEGKQFEGPFYAPTLMRLFVVLAFVLTKLFVLVPCLQVFGGNYTKVLKETSETSMNMAFITMAYILALGSGLFDLVYALYFSVIDARWYASIRSVIVMIFAYAMGINAIV